MERRSGLEKDLLSSHSSHSSRTHKAEASTPRLDKNASTLHSEDEDEKTYIFYAEAVDKGYFIKVMYDVLHDFFNRIEMTITKDNIQIVRVDENKTVCLIADLQRDGFRGYKYSEKNKKIKISIDLTILQKLLKNTKKKESVTMYILAHEPDKFYFRITPEGNKSKINTKSETMSIQTQRLICESEESNAIAPSLDNYYQPVVIDSSDYQKIKKIPHTGSLRVVMNEDNYLSITDEDATYSSSLIFGKKVNNNIYDRTFKKITFRKTSKITGLSGNIFFSAPKNEPGLEKFPLLIRTKIGGYGNFQIFIKDESCIVEGDANDRDYESDHEDEVSFS
jgi:hypothetical protein